MVYKYSSALYLSLLNLKAAIEFHAPFALLKKIKPVSPLSRKLGGSAHYGQKNNLLLCY
jgi:hypothetical protein